MKNKKMLFAIIINAVIVALTIVGMCIAVIDVQVQGIEYVTALIYYTTLSNLLLASSAIISFIFELLVYLKIEKEVPNWVNIVKLCGVTSTTITFLVVVFFLTPTIAMSQNPNATGVAFLYTGSNLIFHVFNPLIAIVLFLLFENTKKIKLPQVCFSMIFTAAYGTIYALDILYEFIPLTGNQAHDWYNFLTIVNGNLLLMPLIVIAFIGISFLVGWLLWLGNRKITFLEKNKSTHSEDLS